MMKSALGVAGKSLKEFFLGPESGDFPHPKDWQGQGIIAQLSRYTP